MKTIFVAAFFLFNISIYAGASIIVAHRGASRDAPENTIPAFKLAWKQGADAIEGDFHLTKDGHIVCIHDGNTENVANTNLVVGESTFPIRRPSTSKSNAVQRSFQHYLKKLRNPNSRESRL